MASSTPPSPGWTDWLGRSGPPPPAWRVLFSGIWLAYLIPGGVKAFGHGHSALYTVAIVAILVAFAAVYIAVVGWWDRGARFIRPGVLALFALAGLACVVYRGDATSLWIYVSVAAGMACRVPSSGRQGVGLAVLGYIAASVLGHRGLGDTLTVLLPVAFGGFAALAFRARFETNRQLMAARETVARMAANEERLRLARDMHDLTGQSLSTITLKSELAARLVGKLPESADRDRALDQVQQVADVSRQALRDIREALSGYRRPTLAVEAITARDALEAAGIVAHDDTALTMLSGTFDPDAEAALAWCLREAVTNVVRHSAAANCWVRLGRRGCDLVLEVRDDGRGIGADSMVIPALGEAPPRGAGHGLRGMSERLHAVGGKLEIRPGRGGFCLVATVPAGAAQRGRKSANVAV